MLTRRETLKQSARVASLLTVTGLFPNFTEAAVNRSAFDVANLPDLFKVLGVATPVESKSVNIQVAESQENGVNVPMGASVALVGVKQLLILVEKNPTPLLAVFNLSDNLEPTVSVRGKLRESSNVYAVAVMSDGQVLFAKKEVKIKVSGFDN